MDTLRIYKYSLALPLVVPILTGAILYISVELFPRPQTYEDVSRWQDAFNLILLMIVGSGFVGGIPYLILVALLLREMKTMDEREVRRSFLLLPVLMVIFFGLILAVFIPFAAGFNLSAIAQFFGVWLAYSVSTIVLGYIYVFLMFGIVRIFRKHWPEWNKKAIASSGSSLSI